MTKRHASAHPIPGGGAGRGAWRELLTGRVAAGLVLALFWAFMVASLRDKSPTYDEVAHAAAGYSYWHFGDYRLQPENGQLPQRVAGLPMALSISPMPAPEPAAWRDSEDWRLGYQWLFRSGHDADSLVSGGRMMCGLFAVALGAVTWAWSRRLFGPVGGMVSLLLFVMSPTILANGALMTSDAAAALFFAASTWGIWALLSRVTLARLVLSTLLVSGLFLTKVSAFLILPIAALIAGARLADGRPLPISLGRAGRLLTARSHQAIAVTSMVAVHAVVAVALIWAAYGFRYSAFSGGAAAAGRFREPWEYLLAKPGPALALQALTLGDEQKAQVQAILVSSGANGQVWTNPTLDAVAAIRREVLTPGQAVTLDRLLDRPSPETWVRVIEAARRCHLMPEAWIYGFTDVYRRSQVRPAFLNGEFRLRGWPSFFPFTFLVKTPLAVFAVMLLALAAVGWRGILSAPRRLRNLWERLYPALPLWALMAIYWAAAIASHLNIGHRHLLPIYAPLFVLCGVSGAWIEAGLASARAAASPASRVAGRAAGGALAVALLALSVEVVRFFPNYLAYFNGLVEPRSAYRHLVDSSLDWGQELPSVRAYLERHRDEAGPSYLSYFGTSSPAYYGIRAYPLYSVAGLDDRDRPDWKNFFLAPEEVASRVPSLRQDWPDYDLLGMQRLGDLEVVTFLRKPERLSLRAGTYLVAASMLQPVNFDLQGPWGPWNERYEATYQGLNAAVRPLMSADRNVRVAAVVRHSGGEWPILLSRFEEYRFGRLCAYLRHREPDDEINFSVMVYKLTGADLEKALDGPAPELGPDFRESGIEMIPENGSERLR